MGELTTICFSHYNERARWALDRCGVSYVERKYMPCIHWAAVWNIGRRYGLGRADKISSKLSAPVFVTDERRALHDSSEIVRYAADCCAPDQQRIIVDDPEVSTLSQRFLKRLGPHSRCVAYHYMLKDSRILRRIGRENVGRVQAQMFQLLYPAVWLSLRKGYKIDEQAAARSLAACREEMTFVSELVGSRLYLVGEQFSDADLTFACMAAPLLVPSPAEGYGARLPKSSDFPREFADLIGEFRMTTAGRFALRMF
ncbi:MAG: glutathione S-transferase N-terminal domain-containing protein, partial [Deltaproteobacteria bacterium]|nr:glutathione S-transferase N-terminal domain-containing protein [Deltaproteobacteria bacterium]